LSRYRIEPVIPSDEQRSAIDRIIFDELVKGRIVESSRDLFRRVTSDLAAGGCDGVVMGCTEIPLILRSEDVDVPLLDSTRLLARAALHEALL
jgi:aspartate racemase